MAIIDWYSRRVLAWRLSTTLETSFCVEALHEALARYGCPEIFNTDQGSQFTSEDFTDVLLDRGIKISMDGKGRFIDNIFVERLLALAEVRGGLPLRLRQRASGSRGHRSLLRFFQRRASARSVRLSNAREFLRWAGQRGCVNDDDQSEKQAVPKLSVFSLFHFPEAPFGRLRKTILRSSRWSF